MMSPLVANTKTRRLTEEHTIYDALRDRNSSSRLGEMGKAVPSSCANTDTLNSSTIHRNSSAGRRAAARLTGSAKPDNPKNAERRSTGPRVSSGTNYPKPGWWCLPKTPSTL